MAKQAKNTLCLRYDGGAEAYRRNLMGQSPGKAAIVTYTHLNELRRHYVDGMRKEMQPVITAVKQKIGPIRMTEN